jgi:rhodanese-related sulfurtransferase
MGILSFFGFGKSPVKEALKKGAIVIDVRTANEYDQGKVPGSINIPVDRINISAERIKGMNKPIVFCCASGMRSGSATRIMKSKGLTEVYNGGSWYSVLKMTKRL